MSKDKIQEGIDFYLDPFELLNKPRRIMQGLQFLTQKINNKYKDDFDFDYSQEDVQTIHDILDELIPTFGAVVFKTKAYKKWLAKQE